MIVAQLGNDEEVLSLHISSSNQLLYALTYGFLIAVHFGIINMLQARHQENSTMMMEVQTQVLQVPKACQLHILICVRWYINMTQQSYVCI